MLLCSAKCWLSTLACVMLVPAASAAIVEEVVQLPTDGAATLPYLRSWDDARPPVVAAVLFSGGGGAVGLQRKGIPRPGANFLVRSRGMFNEQGIATAVIDVRSDQSAMSDGDPMSRRHAEDVRAVVADLHQRFGALPVYLVGTSRGTVSAAYAGAALGDAVDGVVLTSSVFDASRGGSGLSAFDFSSIRTRLLFVHHVDDACPVTPYAMAERAAAAGHRLVSVEGGAPARSGPCEAFSAHGYLGVEGPTVRAITPWLQRQEPPKLVRVEQR
jgi:pimeloyl-ACP methyl ester carboxylesterase